MIPTTLRELAAASGAQLLPGLAGLADVAERTFTGVSTDTRSARPGDLFVSLTGPNFDGNAFAGAAVERGAAALLLRGGPGAPPVLAREELRGTPILLHEDPRRALASLAHWHRARLRAHVLGITGSCGKTTTKNVLVELARAALGDPEPSAVIGSPSSFNNDVGVPHTLLLADAATRLLVVEMGTSGRGEIAGLCRIARPSAAIVTNVGASHLEGLGSVEGVAREKGALPEALPPSGFCVLNADSPWCGELAARTRARVITFSVDGKGELDAREVWFHAGGTTFRLNGRELTSPLLGLSNVQNLLAALAACEGLGLEREACLAAVSRLKPAHRRLEPRVVADRTVIDDSYNANPESARASVRVLAGLHGYARRVLVLGDMLELGPSAAELHHEVGSLAAASGIDLLLVVGEYAAATAAGALESGFPAAHLVHMETLEDALRSVPSLVRSGDVVLVKGSRRAGLERLVDELAGAAV